MEERILAPVIRRSSARSQVTRPRSAKETVQMERIIRRISRVTGKEGPSFPSSRVAPCVLARSSRTYDTFAEIRYLAPRPRTRARTREN